MTLTQEITLDIFNAPLFEYINAKQADNVSRVLVATITANGEVLKPDHTRAQAIFRATKPDKTGVMDPAAIGEDGKITFALTDQVLAVPGDVAAEIAIVEGEQVLTTATFYIQVEKRHGGSGAASTDEFLVLVQATEKAAEAAEAANKAAAYVGGMTVSAEAAADEATVTAQDRDGHLHLSFGLPHGPAGPQGPAGPAGEMGPQGPSGGVESVNGRQGQVVVQDKLAGTAEQLVGFDESGNAVCKDISELLLLAHPVGSYYWSDADTDPGALFGGVWERVKDVFVLAAGDAYTAGAAGGEAAVTLTLGQMPAHNHTYHCFGGTSYAYNGGSAGNFKGYSITSPNTTYGSGAAGSGEAHENMPPYITAYCWRRTA